MNYVTIANRVSSDHLDFADFKFMANKIMKSEKYVSMFVELPSACYALIDPSTSSYKSLCTTIKANPKLSRHVTIMKVDKNTYHLRYRAISNGMKFVEMPWGDVTVSG